MMQIKNADLGKVQIEYAPEYEGCRALTEDLNLPLQVILKAAEAAFENREKLNQMISEIQHMEKSHC